MRCLFPIERAGSIDSPGFDGHEVLKARDSMINDGMAEGFPHETAITVNRRASRK